MQYKNTCFFQIVTLCLVFIISPVCSAGLIFNNLQGIDDSLEQYSAQFPRIKFLRLYGTDGLVRTLTHLKEELGKGVYDMTYEHGYDTRELLVGAQIQRIALMIENSIPSATLFNVGDNSQFKKQYVCVITLDKELFRNNAQSATRLLIGNINIDAQNISENSEIDNIVFANFTLHHEVFHCLDAYLDGPTIHKTSSELENSYELFRGEQRADFFSTLVYRSTNIDENGFLQKLVHYRTLSILDWDMSHFTAQTLKKAIGLREDLFYGYELYDLAEISLRLSDDYVLSPVRFNIFMVAAYHTAVKYNVYDAVQSPEAVELRSKNIDDSSVMLIEKYLHEARQAILY